MAQLASGHPIVDRLANLKKRVRLILAAYGIALLVGTVLATLIVLVTVDYLFPMPGGARLVLGLASLVGFGTIAWRYLFRTLSTQLTEQFLASRVENVSAGMADELIAAVNFIRAGTPQANILAAKAVEAAEARARGLRFEDALDFGPAAKIGGIAAALLVLVALVAIINPKFVGTGIARWVNPIGAAPWTKPLDVEFLWDTVTDDGTQPSVLERGKQVDVRVLVSGVLASKRKVTLYTSVDNGPERASEMTLQPGGSPEKSVFGLSRLEAPDGASNVIFRAVAYDGEKSVKIRLAERPQITAVTATIMPPAYVKNPTPRQADLTHKPEFQAISGSTVTLRVSASNAVAERAPGVPAVTLVKAAGNPAGEVTSKFASDDRRTVEVTMGVYKAPPAAPKEGEQPAAQASAEKFIGRVMLTDGDGLDNKTGGNFEVSVIDDAKSAVTFEAPTSRQTVVPNATIGIRIVATDDTGIDEGIFRIKNARQTAGEKPRFERPLDWTEVTKAQDGSARLTSAFAWDLSGLKLQPKDEINVYGVAVDNYNIDGARRWVESSPLAVTIISEEEMRSIKTAELIKLKTEVEQASLRQQDTAAKVKAIEETIAKSKTATGEQSRQLAELRAQQDQQAQSAKGLSSRFEDLKNSLEVNKMDKTDLGKAAEEAKATMAEVSKDNMAKASSELGKASEAAGKSSSESKAGEQGSKGEPSAKQASESASNARSEQGKAIAKMDKLAKDLNDKFNDVAAIRKKLDDIIKGQDEVTKDLDKATENPKKDELDRLAKKQDDLKNQTAKLQQDMKDKSANSPANSPQKAALDASAKAGEESKVTESQGEASDAASKGKPSSASSSSSSASAGLKKMKQELDNLETRELEALQQELAALIKLLQGHLADETKLKDETTAAGEAAAKEVLRKISENQGRLHVAVIDTKGKANATRESKPAVPFIEKAETAMQSAAVALVEGKQKQALPLQDEAISEINNAIKALEDAKKPVDDKLKEVDLAYFIAEYTAIRDAELKIKTGSDGIKKDSDGTYGRVANRMIGEMAAEQKKATSRLNDVNNHEKLKEYKAVLFINGEILNYMNESEKKLTKAQLGRELAWNQQRAIDRLGEIINALQEEKDKKDEFEKPDGGGGGGGGGGGKPPLIPAAQQLKLLKMMQVGVNRDTTDKNAELTAAANDAEKNAVGEQVQKLGDTQQKIQDVAKKVLDDLKK